MEAGFRSSFIDYSWRAVFALLDKLATPPDCFWSAARKGRMREQRGKLLTEWIKDEFMVSRCVEQNRSGMI